MCSGNKKAKVAPNERSRHVSQAKTPPQIRRAPWAASEQARLKAEELGSAINQLKSTNACANVVASLENDRNRELELLEKVEKKENKCSLFQKIQSTRFFLERATKRHSTLQEEMVALSTKESELRKEIGGSRAKFKSMEKELEQELHQQSAPSSRMHAPPLEEQIRELLVVLHNVRGNLPPAVMEGIQAIKKSLPQESFSDDIGDVGGLLVDESTLAAAKLDEVIPEYVAGSVQEVVMEGTDER